METKFCNGCQTEKETSLFYKSLGKSCGLSSKCKECIRQRERGIEQVKRRRNREKRIRSVLKERTKARKAARKFYKDAFLYKCSVLTCAEKAQDLHHIKYSEPLAVIPLCRTHHHDNHYLCGIEFEQRRQKTIEAYKNKKDD